MRLRRGAPNISIWCVALIGIIGIFAFAHVSHAAPPTGGIFSASGNLLTAFPQVAAGSSVVVGDINNDGAKEIVVGSPPGVRASVTVYRTNAQKAFTIYPYSSTMTFGVNVAIGDCTGNGYTEIVVAPRAGSLTRILRYSNTGRLLSPGFLAFGTNFRGGVNITTGDINGDGVKEIIAAAGIGGGPHVKYFTANGTTLGNLFPYEAAFRGGLVVAALDVNNDGKDEVVVGPQSRRVSDINVYDPATRALISSLRAFGTFVGGVSLSANTSGGGARILVGASAGGYPHVKQFNLVTGALDGVSVFPMPKTWRGGITVAFFAYTTEVQFYGSAGSTNLTATQLAQLGSSTTTQFVGSENRSWEKRTVNTSVGSFSVNIVHLNLTDSRLRVKSLTATRKTNCFNIICEVRSLKSYVDQVRGLIGINGSYFCPADYAACASYPGSFYWMWYNSETKIVTNGYQNQFNNGPVIAFDTANRYHYIKVARDWPGIEAYQSAHNVTISAVISNGPGLLYEGANVLDESTLDLKQRTVKSNRSGIGFKGNDAYLVVASSATVIDLGKIMQALGMEHAMNLDGGGSSALIFDGQYKVGPGRNMPNALVFSYV